MEKFDTSMKKKEKQFGSGIKKKLALRKHLISSFTKGKVRNKKTILRERARGKVCFS